MDLAGTGTRRSRTHREALALARAADPLGEDAQLALHVCYEPHYRGFAGVAPEWEWNPELLRLRSLLEQGFE